MSRILQNTIVVAGRVLPCLLVAVGLSGCGGLSNTSSAANNPAALTAKVQTSPSAVVRSWTPVSLPTGGNLLGYNLSRDGSVIASPTAAQTTYTDSPTAIATTLTYSTVPTSPSLQASTVTVNVTPVTTGVSHTYALTAVYIADVGVVPEYFEVTVGTSQSVTLPTS